MDNTGSAKKRNQPVKVYVRQRPFSKQEIEAHTPNIIQHLTNTEIIIKSGFHVKRYGFDQVFSEETSQKEIYDTVVAPLVNFIILGYNCTVFAYGQTGTGKTYTIVGDKSETLEESSAGLIPRAISHLFRELDVINSTTEYTIRVSFIEIYNEEVRDLLINNGTPLKIFDDPDNKSSVYLKGVRAETVLTAQEALKWLNIGLMERQTASTIMNRHSSRSHSIFTLSVFSRNITVDGEELIKTGKLYMVDLAGSENVGKSGSIDLRAREAGNINKSLLTLVKVIKALAQNTQYVPYRDSKLTRILRDSLGGRTKTCMIATISAGLNVWDETISTLDYAQVARNVSNCPQINEKKKQTVILEDLKDEIRRLRKELAVARAGEGFYICRETYEQLCEELNKNQNELIKTKENLVEFLKTSRLLEVENNSMKKEVQKLHMSIDETKQELKKNKLQSKRFEFIMNYMDKRESELKSTVDYLWKICETSNKHEDLFINKYEKQCEATEKNAVAAKNSHHIYKNSLDMFHKATQSYSDNQKCSFDEIRNNANDLKELNKKMFNCLLDCSKKIQTNVDLDIVIDDKICSDFEEDFNTLLNSECSKVQRNSIEDLMEFNSKKIREVESMTTRCMNTMKQALNDYFLCVNDMLQTHETMIKKMKTMVENSQVDRNNAIINFKENGGKIIRNTFESVKKHVNFRINESNKTAKNILQEVNGIRTQFMAECESKINNLENNFETFQNNHQKYEASVSEVGFQTMERFKKAVDENIQSVTHTGNTPTRQAYNYPRKVEERLPTLLLYQRFENSEA